MTSKLFDLTGQVAVVTGGGRGIGRAIAEGLAAHGARLVVCGRNEAVLAEAVAALKTVNPTAEPLGLAMDVTKDGDVEWVRDQVLKTAGRIDILINNAGIDPHYAPIEQTSPEEWAQIVEVNLTGVFRSCRILGAPMVAAKRGNIINISSIAGHLGLKRQVPYCASKGGVEQLTKALALDWAEHNIRVNAIAYGWVETDLTAGILGHPHIGARLKARVPIGRFAQLSDVAGAAIFLASPAASYVTGHSLMVDGGWTAS